MAMRQTGSKLQRIPALESGGEGAGIPAPEKLAGNHRGHFAGGRCAGRPFRSTVGRTAARAWNET
jgi:hypothetical protein